MFFEDLDSNILEVEYRRALANSRSHPPNPAVLEYPEISREWGKEMMFGKQKLKLSTKDLRKS